MSEYKQCIVTRDDLKLAEWASKGDLEKWKEGGQKKIVLKVPSIKELYELKEKARREGLPTALIQDAGLTEIPPGTVTVLGIGPAKEELIDKITKDLKLV
ncbi:Peptidyl-tRNA hydrolase, archaeal type [Methanosarcina mazei Tuc01]|uniref:peptidyl-tRNA hydrolase n=1 Tax=Methanosarcina mazei Tuc01 TaxID=1236903 RepID=M1Q606_METMZ|nr:aminoacyl-tRNA hydrolase [Methanosarcina mazei]AGF95573.1 Peptidyl-tRNA hydrolase, archaeal type [Methanosarcina mazei Tuc01]